LANIQNIVRALKQGMHKARMELAESTYLTKMLGQKVEIRINTIIINPPCKGGYM
jgi:hypothetical protein